MPTTAKKILLATAAAVSVTLATLVAVTLAQGGHRPFSDSLAQAENSSGGFVQSVGATGGDLYVSAVAPSGHQSQVRELFGLPRICPANWGSWWHCLYCMAIGYLKPGVGCPSLLNGWR